MNREIIEAEIEQLLGKCAWTHKIQEKQADIYHNRMDLLENCRICFSAITASGLLVIVFSEQGYWLKLITAIIALINTGINLYLKKCDFKSLEKLHKENAVKWLALREDYTSLISEIRANVLIDEEIIERKRTLLEQYKFIASEAPITTDGAYEEAKIALKINMDNIITQEEIDVFIPERLRRERNNGIG